MLCAQCAKRIVHTTYKSFARRSRASTRRERAKPLHLLCQLKTALGFVGNHAGDDQRGGGCWRRRVLHVNDVLTMLYEKVIHQPAIRRQSLGAHTAGTGKQVSSL